ncbi:MAG: hypothetical protein LBU04_01095 [Christensenellaceae bacterium]|jgi:hypothetical protein|nr:hypothetical protein [Christensenellaceae bacterium]
MQKNAPKILAAVLVVTIAVLALLSNSSNIRNLLDTSLAKAIEEEESVPIETPPVTENISDSESTTDTIVNKTLFDKYPKSPLSSDRYLFEQSISLNDKITLNKVHNTSSGAFVILTTNAQSGDFNVERETVVVVNVSKSGTIQGLVRLNTTSIGRYITSQITIYGLVVSVSSDDKTYLFHIDGLLGISRIIELGKAQMVSLFSLTDGYLAVLENDANYAYIIKDGIINASALLPKGNIVDIFELANQFIIFLNTTDGYRVVFEDKNLRSFEQKLITGKTLSNIVPISNENAQSFIAIERMNGVVYFTRYSKSYTTSGNESFYIGPCESSMVYGNNDRIFLLLKTNTHVNCYLIKHNMSAQITNSDLFDNVMEIFGCHKYNDGFYLLGKSNDKLVFINIQNNGIITEKTISENPLFVDFLRYQNGETTLFFTTLNQNEIKIVKLIH